MSKRWCQNPKCPEKRLKSQIRGNKGHKFYQSNSAGFFGNKNFCTLYCYDQWATIYMDRALDTLNIRITEPVKHLMTETWYVNYSYEGYQNGEWIGRYTLCNDLMGINRTITNIEGTVADESYPNGRRKRNISEAHELAKSIGLTQ